MFETLTPDIRDYAETLRAAGFTVYAPPSPQPSHARPLSFFHYSRDVDGVTCWGTYSGPDGLNSGGHTMPLTPSKLNGSGAYIDAPHDAETVAYAETVARPSNWCPYNAEPTADAPRRGYGKNGGATLANAQPWGIGTHYVAQLTEDQATARIVRMAQPERADMVTPAEFVANVRDTLAGVTA